MSTNLLVFVTAAFFEIAGCFAFWVLILMVGRSRSAVNHTDSYDGKSGQISLGKSYAGKTLRLERRKDGTMVLTAVAVVPESQLWTLEEPHRSRIERGLAWAAETQPRETDVDGLLKRRTKRVGRTRGRRRQACPPGPQQPRVSGCVLPP